jgi:hypothetical protein
MVQTKMYRGRTRVERISSLAGGLPFVGLWGRSLIEIYLDQVYDL